MTSEIYFAMKYWGYFFFIVLLKKSYWHVSLFSTDTTATTLHYYYNGFFFSPFIWPLTFMKNIELEALALLALGDMQQNLIVILYI